MLATPNAGIKLALYPLYYIDKIAAFDGLSASQLKTLPADRSTIIEALEWICANPDVDLRNALPNLRHDSDEIHRYAAILLRQLK